ncbi:MAG: TRAP transporter large permease subunit [Rhodospirillum sp.]|nr:TRAP transporter large permease subunit [Rhodospirillum sp.]MCF8489706.1 TRAP transporter large permease subunit [Rhodospirillum sp.]MCF8502569.1 TRAP transporter large permease subunit [Rhodospirillum sp.]
MTFLEGVLILLTVIGLGMPVGFALGVAGILALMLIVPAAALAGLMTSVVHGTVSSYIILTIPMFILMAEFLSAGGVSQDLMLACGRTLRRLRGGVALACVFAGAILASASGSSTASAASLSRAAYPSMKAMGYRPSFAIGTIAISGTLAIMIPPSIAFVVYGLMTEVSIGKLFVAGFLPGLLTALGYVAAILLTLWLCPDAAPPPGRDLPDASDSQGRVWPIMILVVIVLGCLYGGVATPSEVAALGALAAGIISFASGRMTRHGFTSALGNTLRTTAMIVTIIFGAHLFGYFISFTQITNSLLAVIADSDLSPYIVVLMIVAVYLMLGMIMDQMAIIILTAPITHALVTSLGFDGIWFGVILVKTAEIGLVTPPMGLNVFIACSAAGVDTRTGFKGVLPFVAVELVILGVLLAFPGLVLFLPNAL